VGNEPSGPGCPAGGGAREKRGASFDLFGRPAKRDPAGQHHLCPLRVEQEKRKGSERRSRGPVRLSRGRGRKEVDECPPLRWGEGVEKKGETALPPWRERESAADRLHARRDRGRGARPFVDEERGTIGAMFSRSGKEVREGKRRVGIGTGFLRRRIVKGGWVPRSGVPKEGCGWRLPVRCEGKRKEKLCGSPSSREGEKGLAFCRGPGSGGKSRLRKGAIPAPKATCHLSQQQKKGRRSIRVHGFRREFVEERKDTGSPSAAAWRKKGSAAGVLPGGATTRNHRKGKRTSSSLPEEKKNRSPLT